MTELVRWGILGTGGIAGMFVSDLRADGFVITAVGSRTKESADSFAQAWGIPNAHASYEDLVADPEVDIIYVSTPHPFHAENTKLALNAGKHVLVEKPFTLNAPEAKEIVSLAAHKKLVVLEAMWTRWLPHMVRIREIIAAGTIGEVRALIADHTQDLPKDREHRINNPALGGGALLDLGIYPISFAWDLFGKPARIQSAAAMTATGVDRQTSIIFSYNEGQQAVLYTQLDARGPNTASILGTKGRIDIESVWYTPVPFTVYDNAGDVLERFDEPVTTRGMQFQAWEAERLVVAGIISGDVLPPTESAAIMATLDEIRAQIGVKYPGE